MRLLSAILFISLISLKAETPNIILLIADDQGYGDFGVMGNHLMKTPNIDQMAAESFLMTRFYVNAVCSPTRSALMTGRNSYRTGVTDTWKGRSTMREQEFTIAELLKTKGYATGLFGKWHLGDNYPNRPMEQGFDKAIYHQGGGLGQPADPLENKMRYTDPVLFDNGKKYQAKGFCCDIYYEEAIKWFSQQNSKGKPFFAYIATNTPHAPFHDVPEKWYSYYKSKDLSKKNFKHEKGHPIAGKSRNDTDARIYAMVSNIDENVGKVFKALKVLGIKKETIVIYLTDNGPNGYRYAGGFKGKKSMSTEGGIRSPLWIHWPAKLKAGASSDLVTAHIDLMPTFAEITGAKMPTDRKIDGRSILPALLGKNLRWNDRKIILQSHRGDRPKRLINSAIVSQNWKIETDLAGNMSMFDIKNDPYCLKNLADSKPEVKKQMLSFYDNWIKGLDDEYPNMWEPRHIVLGATDEEVFLTRQEMIFAGNERWHVHESSGWWNVNFTKSGEYSIAFQLLKNCSNVKADLLVNGNVLQSKKFQNLEKMMFDKVSISSGEARLMIKLTADGKSAGAWHVFVK